MSVVSEYNREASIIRGPGPPGSVEPNKKDIKLWNIIRKYLKIIN